jgi:dual specificity tyrosine-phosphorylation-regulated kinase 2/3/4
LKPENIILCDDHCKKLKLVDFGSGCKKSEQVYTYVQSRFYRAPEVVLRVPYSCKVDMWSLGCIVAELFTGEPLFPGDSEQELLEMMMQLLGIPPQELTNKSRKKKHYFDSDGSPYLIEDPAEGILRIPGSKSLVQAVPCGDTQMLSFISGCLQMDPSKRMSARDALAHPFVKKRF